MEILTSLFNFIKNRVLHGHVLMNGFILITIIFLMPANQFAIYDFDVLDTHHRIFKSKEVIQLEMIEDALSLEESLDYTGAINILSRILEEGPVVKLVGEIYYHRGCLYQEMGDDEQAIADFEEVTRNSPPLFILKDTLYRLGELNYYLGNYTPAQSYFNEATSYFSADERHRKTVFQMAYIALQENDWGRSIAFFDSFNTITPDLLDFGYFYKAKALVGADRHDEAIQLFKTIERNFPRSPLLAETAFETAMCYMHARKYDQALRQFKQLKRTSGIDRIRLDYYMAVCEKNAGRTDQALAAFRGIIKDHPKSEFSSYALDQIRVLTNGNFAARDFYDAGYIRYYKREYSKAATNFEIFIKKAPNSPDADEAQLMLARSLHRDEKYKRAIREFSTFINAVQDHPRLGEAIYLLGNSYARNGDYEKAIEEFERLITRYPGHSLAADALHDLARSQESLKEFKAARLTYEKMWKNYPHSMTSQKAQFEIGLTLFMEGDFHEAEIAFGQLAESSPDSDLGESATYWLAQSYAAQNDTETADEIMTLLEKFYPNSYYMAFDAGYFEPETRYINERDYSKARQILYQDLLDLKSWLLQKYPERDFRDVGQQLEKHPAYIKGTILTSLGLREEAKDELYEVEKEYIHDPLTLWHLLRYYFKNDYNQRSIYCARKITNATAGDADKAPFFLQRMIYPIHYPELIFDASQSMNLDPLLVCAIIRQESMFEAKISSWANAHGLMQVIPSTGRYIAKSLEVEDFKVESLHSPKRSLQFGTWYLFEQLTNFDNRVPRALAGYNGGPGNVNRWVKMSGPGRDDLLSEKITYKETRNYVKRILGHYQYYQRLWGEYFKKEI